MNENLPPSLRSRVTEPSDPEVSEDFRNLLEEIIRQNKEILERLDDKKPIVQSGVVAFWNNLFSETGAIITFFICIALVLIFIF